MKDKPNVICTDFKEAPKKKVDLCRRFFIKKVSLLVFSLIFSSDLWLEKKYRSKKWNFYRCFSAKNY